MSTDIALLTRDPDASVTRQRGKGGPHAPIDSWPVPRRRHPGARPHGLRQQVRHRQRHRVAVALPTPSKSGAACTTKETLAATDTNGTFCLTTGTTVRILLDGTTTRPWTPVKTVGSGLKPTNSGILIRPGDASNAYEAVSAGTVKLTSSRPLCATAPHKISCKGIQAWSVTVVVSKP